MLRTTNLFGVAAAMLLILGLFLGSGGAIARHNGMAQGMAIHWGRTAYAISMQTPCNGVAALFCIFAFVYSIRYIPLSNATAQWHFWLSLAAVLLFAAGWTGFSILARGETTEGSSVTLVAVSLLGSVLIFLLAQAWFAVGLTRAVLKMRQI